MFSEILDVKGDDQYDELRDASDRILLLVTALRGNLTELLADQTELKQNIRTVRDMVTDARKEASTNSDIIKTNLEETQEQLGIRIDNTRSRLTENTSLESNQTRGKVEGTLDIVTQIQESVILNKTELNKMRIDLQKQIDDMQQAMMAKTEAGIAQCIKMRADLEKQVSEMHHAVVDKSEKSMAHCLSLIIEMKAESRKQFDEIKLLYASDKLTSSV